MSSSSAAALIAVALQAIAVAGCARDPTPFIRATPNPVPPGGDLGRTVIAWSTANGHGGRVTVRDRTGETLFALSPSGTQPAPWIAAGVEYEFRLYDDDAQTLLATVRVARWNEGRWIALVWALPLFTIIACIAGGYAIWRRRAAAAAWSARDPAIRTALATALVWTAGLFYASVLSASFPNQIRINAWFESDQPSILYRMVVPGARSPRPVHPLFRMLTSTLVNAAAGLGADRDLAARSIIRLAGACTAALLFTALRRVGARIFDAFLVTIAFLNSAAFVHWFGLTETTPLASCSVALLLAVAAKETGAGNVAWVIASALTLGLTVTNWTIALAAGYFRMPLRRFVHTAATAAGLVCVLVLAEKAVYPLRTPLFFSPWTIAREWIWTQPYQQALGNGSWSPLANLRSLWLYTGVAPTPVVEGTVVTNQMIGLSGFGAVGLVAVGAWLCLIGLAAIAATRQDGARREIVYACAAFLIAQSLLHSIYGTITFLYSAHVAPVLFLLIGMAFRESDPRLARAVCLVFILAGGFWNLEVFRRAIELVTMVTLH